MDQPHGPGGSAMLCQGCSATLSHDQRYCLDCGARRGPLPGWIGERIAAIHEQGGATLSTSGTRATFVADTAGPTAFGFTMPDPRLAAVAVMGMLSAGVVVGSLASSTVAGIVSAPLILIERATGDSSAGTGGDSTPSSAGGGTQVITVTSPAPAAAPAAGPLLSGPPQQPAPSPSGGPSGSGSFGALPPIKHVFLIVLSDQGFNQSFSPASHDSYLNRTLVKQGKLIQSYYAVAPSPLANGIALISGQGPNPQTAANCPTFSAIRPFKEGAMQQVLGSGCVYPASTQTIAGQLTARHRTWKAYIEGMGGTSRGRPLTCQRPKLGAADLTQAPGPHRAYLTPRNPFVYFNSLAAGKACSTNDVSLDQLAGDLKTSSKAPSLAYIAPSACDDGSDQPCSPSSRGGLPAADKFLRQTVALIKRSAAYKDKGLIAITFDRAPQTGLHADHSACCNNPAYPNLPVTSSQGTTTSSTVATPSSPTPSSPTATTSSTATQSTNPLSVLSTIVPVLTGPVSSTTTSSAPATAPGTTSTASSTTSTTTSALASPPSTGGQTSSTGGGGQVGLLLISPYVKPGTIDVVDYFNHFSLLASFEKLFGLGRLGYARDLQLPTFDASIFDAHP